MSDTMVFDEAAHAAAYLGVQERVIDLVRAASPEALDAIAPATPQWRTRDVFAHMVGVATDVLNGNITDAGGDRWTAAQVAARYDPPIEELIDEWVASGSPMEAFVLSLPTSITGQLVLDTTTHEHDLRHALGRPGARDSDSVAMSAVWIVNALGQFYDAAGEQPLRFEGETVRATAGTGEPVATVRAPTFELVRAITGRRTLAEIAAYEWEPEAQCDRVVALPLFTAAPTSLGE
jgi:uncharacterized protein (TIGR03083 family)